MLSDGHSEVALFRNSDRLRRIFHEKEWFYAIVDVIEIITGTNQPARYWNEVKKNLETVEKLELFGKSEKLKFMASDGKMRATECANAETIFRIIQSIPSPRAEPFKQWFAKIAYERILEFQNPEIAEKRAIMLYKIKGYDEDWISNRIKGIAVRNELTEEWKTRGITGNLEYAKLTNVIHKGTFDKTVREHQRHKDLSKADELRDHMTPIELALTMLAETATKELAKSDNAIGYEMNKTAATKGGEVGKSARISIE